MAALSAGHFATDFANGALPALLPFFVDRFSLSYTLAAALMLASAASSSLIQPLFGALSDRRGALALLLGVIAFRSVAWFGLITFVPLWEVSLGHSKSHGSHLLSLMLLAGGVGTLAAGPIADRLGRRPVLVASMLFVGPLTLAYVLVGGVLGAVALALVGVCVISTFGVTMVMSQEYLPRRIGMASGLSIGLSIGLGGIAAIALGALADSVDLRTAMYAAAAAAVPGFVLAALLPSSRASRRLTPEPVV